MNKLVPKIEAIDEVKNEVTILGVDELGASSIVYSLMFECLHDVQLKVKRMVLKTMIKLKLIMRLMMKQLKY